jgi:hypothetical protein
MCSNALGSRAAKVIAEHRETLDLEYLVGSI